MKVRVPMSGKLRLQMIGYGILTFIICIWLRPYVAADAAQTLLGVGILAGPVAVLGGIVGVQDHKL